MSNILDQYTFTHENGNTILTFNCSAKLSNKLLELQKSGELEKILGTNILEIDAYSFEQPTPAKIVKDIKIPPLSQWLKRIEVTDWLYDIGTKATRLAQKASQQLTGNTGLAQATLRNIPNNSIPNNVANIGAVASRSSNLGNISLLLLWIIELGIGAALITRYYNSVNNSPENNQLINKPPENNQLSLDDVINLLNSNNKELVLVIAYELGNQTKSNDIPQEIIDTLANRIETTDDPEISWQLALTLGKLAPEHLKGAVAQRKRIQLAGERLELFLALRISEDDLIDVLLQVYHLRKDNLPVGLTVSLLDETETSFHEKTAQENQKYLSFEFTGALGEFFSIKLSLGDNDLIENFQI